jgi:hypothetical protein
VAIITGPLLIPAPNEGAEIRYGLFSVVPPRALPDQARLGGLEYQIAENFGSRSYDVTCAPGATKTFDGGPATVVANPFLIYTSLSCGLVGHTMDEIRAYLEERARVAEQGAVELAFSNSANGLNLGLANNASAVTLAASSNVIAAISALEGWLYQTQAYGKPGVLHIPAVAAVWLHQVNVISKGPDGIWRTPIGTMVSIGNYSGNLPNGSAPAAGHTTFYITGQMGLWREPTALIPDLGETIDRALNQWNGLAERFYVASIDEFVAGTDTTLAYA